jgi:DNA-binding transcriptional regulator YhcF (GntR family)
MTEDRDGLVDTLRGRVLRGLQAGTLRAGDRLPSAREAAAEFDVDHRLVIAAYKRLETEQLVELRPRGGVYVTARPHTERGLPPLPEGWIVEVLVQGLGRELPAPELHEWLRRCVETLRLRAVVIASTEDQGYGLCRELSDDFGFESDSMLADEVRGQAAAPLAIRRADLLVTTQAHAGWVQALGAELRKAVTVIDVRPELRGGEWALLLRRPVYAVVATPEFGDMLRSFFAQVPGVENLRIVVYGQDDLTTIPDGAPTYVTQRVRAALGGVRIPGRVLPAARTISTESAREIFAFVVRANIEAMTRLDR